VRLTELEKALLPMFHNLIRLLAIRSPIGVGRMLVRAVTVICGRTTKIV
jgi:hypothetical protein